jgi:hypothetical protein
MLFYDYVWLATEVKFSTTTISVKRKCGDPIKCADIPTLIAPKHDEPFTDRKETNVGLGLIADPDSSTSGNLGIKAVLWISSPQMACSTRLRRLQGKAQLTQIRASLSLTYEIPIE